MIDKRTGQRTTSRRTLSLVPSSPSSHLAPRTVWEQRKLLRHFPFSAPRLLPTRLPASQRPARAEARNVQHAGRRLLHARQRRCRRQPTPRAAAAAAAEHAVDVGLRGEAGRVAARATAAHEAHLGRLGRDGR